MTSRDIRSEPSSVDPDAGRQGIGQRPAGPCARCLMAVLWPAFLTTIVAEGVLFSLVDPHELLSVDLHLNSSREAAYTAGFLIMWLLFSASSGLTYWLMADKR